MQARDLYRLLVEDSAPIRHAAAELVAGMLEPQGRHFLAQVRLLMFPHLPTSSTQDTHGSL